MFDLKRQLEITLTEPIAFLRSSDPSGRQHSDPNDPPTLVRGILNLHVVKPIGISSIEVELAGVLTLRLPPDELGSRRMELPEQRRIHTSAVTVFRADQVPHGRRPASVGPGLSPANSTGSNGRHAVTTLPSSAPRIRSERRNSISVPPDPGPTPPYTSVPEFQGPIQSRLDGPVENPDHTLGQLGQSPRSSPEGQTHRNGSVPPSFRPHSIDVSLSNHTNSSGTLNDSLLPEDDNHTDDMAHTNSPLSPWEGSTSLHSASEEGPQPLPHHDISPSHPSRTHSPGNTRGAQPHPRVNNHDSSNTPHGRSRLHNALSSVLDAVMEVTSRAPSRSRSVAEERGRGRTRVRAADEEQNREGIEASEGVTGTWDGSQLGGQSSHPCRHMEHREHHHLLGLGRVLGLERGHEDKDGEQKCKEQHDGGWREFKPGTYSYPISFLLPPNLPPTFSVPHGSLNYIIKAVAHRPGTFTSKLSCQVPLIVVAAPAIGAEGGGGDPGPLFVQRQWEEKLAYSLGLSSRLFFLGSRRHLETTTSTGVHANAESPVEAEAEATYGTVTLDLTLLPLEKVKIWRLSVVVDESIRYNDERGQLLTIVKGQVKLLEVEDKCLTEEMDPVDEEDQTRKKKDRKKHEFTQIPLLPTPISPHRSPLLRYLPSSTDPSILAGPGPYTLSTSIGLPSCNDPCGGLHGLHFTVKQTSSSVKVEHSLRVVLRAEWVGNEGTSENARGQKKKLFDIAVQTPVTILSCRCVPEYQTLPTYSEITEDGFQSPAVCACHPASVARPPMERGRGREVENHPGLVHPMVSSSTSSFESDNGARYFRHHHQIDEQRNGRQHSRSSSLAPFHVQTQAQTHSHGPGPGPDHHHSHSQSYSVSMYHVRSHSQTPISTPYVSRPPSPLAQYERLMSGLESDAGDAPPSYENIASGF